MSNDLPLGWCECVVKDVCDIKTGKLDANAADDNGAFPFFTCALMPSRINSYTFDGKCIYLPGNGANVGYVGYYEGKFNAYQRTYVLSDIQLDSKYLYYGLLINWKNYNKDKQYGVATNFIRLGNLENYPINFPPLNEQVRIVEKIEELFSDIDDGIKTLKTTLSQIKQYRQSVLKSAFDGKLHKTTEWKDIKLNDVCSKINDGTHFTPTYTNFGIPFISVKDVKNKKIYFDNCKYISEEEHLTLYKRCSPANGDVLITKSGTIGRTCVISTENEFSLFVSVALLKPISKLIVSYYLMYALDNYIAKIDIKQDIKGGVIKNLHIEDLKKIKILLPTLPEQEKIVEEIEKRFAVADQMEQAVTDSLAKAEKLKQSILKKAFAGKLVSQDPNDEPASTLLARIKAQKQNSSKKGKSK